MANMRAVTPGGKRYGFVIDVPKFAEDKDLAQACINACHSIHNVPDFGNKKDEIKWIWTETYAHAFPDESQYKRNEALHSMPIMTLCNHCDNPPCVRACPTKATFKNPDGLVMMDFIAASAAGSAWPPVLTVPEASTGEIRGPSSRRRIQNSRPGCAVWWRSAPCATSVWPRERFRPVLRQARAVGRIIFGDLNDPASEISQVLKEKFTIQTETGAWHQAVDFLHHLR